MKLRTRKFLAGLLSLGLLLQAASPLSALAALLKSPALVMWFWKTRALAL